MGFDGTVQAGLVPGSAGVTTPGVQEGLCVAADWCLVVLE